MTQQKPDPSKGKEERPERQPRERGSEPWKPEDESSRSSEPRREGEDKPRSH